MRQILFFTILLSQITPAVSVAKIFSNNQKADAIYGIDDRKFVDRHSSENIKKISESVAMIVSKDSIQKSILTTKILAGRLTDTAGVNICRDEKFAKHHSLNACSGFLIGEDLMATAGHCFRGDYDCSNKVIAFEVLKKNEVRDGYKISNANVYECKEIISTVNDTENSIDFAIIRLNKKVIGKEVLKLRSSGSIGEKEKVFMIGHPLGLPQLVTNSAIVSDISSSHFFKTKLDSFEGNSGSPVINSKTFEVEGILVRGEDDFTLDEEAHCNRQNKYSETTDGADGLSGEAVNRISDILNLLPR